HLVVMYARDPRIEADRIGIRDEVDLVAAIGKFQAQLGGHDSAAAVGWIARDTDFHCFSVAPAEVSTAAPIWPFTFSTGWATLPPPNHTRIRPPSTSTEESQMT